MKTKKVSEIKEGDVVNFWPGFAPNQDEQRQAVDNFAIGYQVLPEEEAEGGEMDFPECQYVANGLDLEEAQILGDWYREGLSIPPIGHEATDRISNRLNKMQSQRFPLRK